LVGECQRTGVETICMRQRDDLSTGVM
jgi:hypothetical protein